MSGHADLSKRWEDARKNLEVWSWLSEAQRLVRFPGDSNRASLCPMVGRSPTRFVKGSLKIIPKKVTKNSKNCQNV